MRSKLCTMILVVGLLLATLPAARPAQATIYVVNWTDDLNDGVCDATHCSLREAIALANLNVGPDEIHFDIDPDAPGAYCNTTTRVCTIRAQFGGYTLQDDGNTTIDGYTQPGAAPATGGTPASLKIVIDGSLLSGSGGAGLTIFTGGNTVRGLAINGFPGHGVMIGGPNAVGNVLAGNYIGVDVTGAISVPNSMSGVWITTGGQGNTIGGDTAAERNVISGNDEYGVLIEGVDAMSNTVSGNYIGLSSSGTWVLPNGLDGVHIGDGAQDNTVGGVGLRRNLISGNGRHGVSIGGVDATGNAVLGNYIGLKSNGQGGAGNAEHGVYFWDGAHDNTIGGDPGAAEHNVISDNGIHGVCMEGSTTMSNTVAGNYIGVLTDGTTAAGNTASGVYIGDGAHDNTVGGNSVSDRNVISGNDAYGVLIEGYGADGNVVAGNSIGTDASGTSAVGNGQQGVAIADGAMSNVVGGDEAGAGNLISGNLSSGVEISGGDAKFNQVSGNFIGTDVNGTATLANAGYGVIVTDGAQNNVIGGDEAGEGNLISGNDRCGVQIGESGTWGNVVAGNLIGTDVNGTAALANGWDGVRIGAGTQGNTVGGNTAGERNVISGNGQRGVRITEGATANMVSGNYIGTDASGTAPLGNTSSGVFIHLGAQENVVGGNTSGERNVISGNGLSGVRIYETDTMSNTVAGNYIGTDASGTVALGNASSGVYVDNGARNNTVGGLAAGEGNVLSGNDQMGVEITGSGTDGNVVLGNTIGLAADGATPLGNDEFGVHIYLGAQDNTVGPGNVIAHNLLAGVVVAQNTTTGNVITQNSIYSNDGKGIVLLTGANGGIQAPVIVGVIESSVEVTGTACPGCTVELFENPDDSGEGKTYLGSGVADGSGVFTVTVAGQTQPYLTATATDVTSGTSTFSEVYGPEQWAVFLPIVVRGS